jgi:hypothetical protein
MVGPLRPNTATNEGIGCFGVNGQTLNSRGHGGELGVGTMAVDQVSTWTASRSESGKLTLAIRQK